MTKEPSPPVAATRQGTAASHQRSRQPGILAIDAKPGQPIPRARRNENELETEQERTVKRMQLPPHLEPCIQI